MKPKYLILSLAQVHFTGLTCIPELHRISRTCLVSFRYLSKVPYLMITMSLMYSNAWERCEKISASLTWNTLLDITMPIGTKRYSYSPHGVTIVHVFLALLLSFIS